MIELSLEQRDIIKALTIYRFLGQYSRLDLSLAASIVEASIDDPDALPAIDILKEILTVLDSENYRMG